MMKWRSILLLVLVASEGVTATASEPLDEPTAHVAASEVRVVTVPAAVIEPASSVFDDALPEPIMSSPIDEALREIRWTVPASMTLGELSIAWGIPGERLVALNAELRGRDRVQATTRLVVYRTALDEPSRSVGSPNRGRLHNGVPLPEGDAWTLREHRARAFGTPLAVRALVEGLTRWGRQYPDGPRVHIGELSYRRGGRAWPHVSHRTGRDVDIGYVMRDGTLGQRYWRSADAETLDVEKSWALIESIVATGQVQKIFISSKLQRLFKEHARTRMSEDELARYFRVAGGDPKQRYLISHEDGHRDHMHVRFRCDAANPRCLSSVVDDEPPGE